MHSPMTFLALATLVLAIVAGSATEELIAVPLLLVPARCAQMVRIDGLEVDVSVSGRADGGCSYLL